MQKREDVPDLFRSVFFKDVTATYSPVTKVKIKIHPQMRTPNNYAYLSVFDNIKWKPIAYGDVTGKRACFDDMCMNIVYLPVSYSNGRIKPLNYPFLLDYDGNVSYFVPDTTAYRSIVIDRKYPVFTKTFDAIMRSIGAKFQASNSEDFSHPVTIHEFSEWKAAETIPINDSLPPYRYWRFLAPQDGGCSIAELMFYRQGDIIPSTGKIIGTEIMRLGKENVFDNEPLTYCESYEEDRGTWVGLDFGEPTKIDKIIFLPRSDDNTVRIGDEYELLYWGADGWQSLGRQTAKDIQLQYNNVPENALLLLQDHTRGEEERIFTYENGCQIWW
jgi:hypothetical protein